MKRGSILQKKSLETKFLKIPNFAWKMRGFNFTNEIPLNKICENLRIFLKKWSRVQFWKRNPFIRIFWKSQRFAQQNGGRVNFRKEIPFKEKVWKPQILAPNYHKIRYFLHFKNMFPYESFENEIPTPQLDIKFGNL